MITAVRALRRHPGASLAAIVTLALGLGLSATIFTVVHSVLLRPFPFAEQERLVTIWSNKPASDLARIEVLWDDLERFRTEAGVFDEVAAVSAANNGVLVRRGDDLLHHQAHFVSEPLFRSLGVQPHKGRLFRPEEHKPGVNPIAVMSYATWKDDFGSDEAVFDKPISIDGQAIEVVGVLPPHLNIPADRGSLRFARRLGRAGATCSASCSPRPWSFRSWDRWSASYSRHWRSRVGMTEWDRCPPRESRAAHAAGQPNLLAGAAPPHTLVRHLGFRA